MSQGGMRQPPGIAPDEINLRAKRNGGTLGRILGRYRAAATGHRCGRRPRTRSCRAGQSRWKATELLDSLFVAITVLGRWIASAARVWVTHPK